MDPQVVTQVGAQAQGLAGFLGEYGVGGVLVLLILVVGHLYRQQVAQGKEMRAITEKYAADTAKLQEQTLEELRRSRECVERNTEALTKLSRDFG